MPVIFFCLALDEESLKVCGKFWRERVTSPAPDRNFILLLLLPVLLPVSLLRQEALTGLTSLAILGIILTFTINGRPVCNHVPVITGTVPLDKTLYNDKVNSRSTVQTGPHLPISHSCICSPVTRTHLLWCDVQGKCLGIRFI